MMSQEEVRERINSLRSPHWLERKSMEVERFEGASAWLRTLKESLFSAFLQRDALSVSNYSNAERYDFFERMFPRLAQEMEHAWQQLALAPTGYCYATSCQPFRDSRDSESLDTRRNFWIQSLIFELRGLNPDPEWLANWGGFLNSSTHQFSSVIAAALDAGGSRGGKILATLRDRAADNHLTGGMGPYVVSALSRSTHPAAWGELCRLIVEPQSTQGLRSTIFELCQHGHPGAFRAVLETILERDLTCIPATVRAVNRWLDMGLDTAAAEAARQVVKKVVQYMDDPSAQDEAILSEDAPNVYVALWSMALTDSLGATERAAMVSLEDSPAKRAAAFMILGWVGLEESLPSLLKGVSDPDISIASEAVDALLKLHVPREQTGPFIEESGNQSLGHSGRIRKDDAFSALEHLMSRAPAKATEFQPLVFPWRRTSLGSFTVGWAMLKWCPRKSPLRLVPHLNRFDAETRKRAVAFFADRNNLEDGTERPFGELPEAARSVLLQMLGDPAAKVREAVAEIIGSSRPSADEVQRHEELLARQTIDVRKLALKRLLLQPDADVLGSANRLVAAGGLRAEAACELVTSLLDLNRSVLHARRWAESALQNPIMPRKGALILDRIVQKQARSAPSHLDAFGLASDFVPRPVPALRRLPKLEFTPAAVHTVRFLDELVDEHHAMELRCESDAGPIHESSRRLLGAVTAHSFDGPGETSPKEIARGKCPVTPLLGSWLSQRSETMRDPDGMELFRAWVLVQLMHKPYASGNKQWRSEIKRLAGDRLENLHYIHAVDLLLGWALRLHHPDCTSICLDQVETCIAHRAMNEARQWIRLYHTCPANWDRRYAVDVLTRRDILNRAAAPIESAQLLAAARNGSEAQNLQSSFDLKLVEVMILWDAGVVSDSELLVRATRMTRNGPNRYHATDSEHFLSYPDLGSAFRTIPVTPRLTALIDTLRRRVLEIEIARGDAPTPASPCAARLWNSGGIEACIPALAAMHDSKLARPSVVHDAVGKAAMLSRLIRYSRPGPDDTPQAFAEAARHASVSERKLIELGLYQPLWSSHIAHTLGWPGLEESLFWFRSHTSARHSETKRTLRQWAARVAELTPIPADRLDDGATDRAWFERCHASLGTERWDVLYEAAKYTSSGTGNIRARLFADAMLGKVSEAELTRRIVEKRDQAAARALALLKIEPGRAGKNQLLNRFKTLHEMRRTSPEHGRSMLQASERLAVDVAIENLARNAGYPDPLRLQWTMEIEEVGDLAKVPICVRVADVTVMLSINEQGIPQLSATKGQEPLKSTPAAIKKHPDVAPLVERLTSLKKQGPQVCQSLEQAMCRGDWFTGSELRALHSHPLLRNILARLVFVAKTQAGATLIGYLEQDGRLIRSLDSVESIASEDSFRLAHPTDLLDSGQWSEWQRGCFAAQRIQPFKQVFREVYVPLAAELSKSVAGASHRATRFEGRPVTSDKAHALFGTRGWVDRPEQGVQRTFHADQVTAHIEFQNVFHTPAEVDCLTSSAISFHQAGTATPIAIKDLPRRVFSEVLRDLDLVSSAAHRSGEEPEASQSTVELRAALLRETCALLSLLNITIQDKCAVIRGELGQYSLDLGSGAVYVLPEGDLRVIPFHSQYRRKIFLPFADDDPKTAEIVRKALLLARDREIGDLSVVLQIRRE